MAKKLTHKEILANKKTNRKNKWIKHKKYKDRIISKTKTPKNTIFLSRIKKSNNVQSVQGFALITIGLFLISSFFIVFPTLDINEGVSETENSLYSQKQKNGASGEDSWKYTKEGNSSDNDGIYDIIQESNTGTEYKFNPYPDYKVSEIPSNGYHELQVDFQTSNLETEDINLQVWDYSAKQWNNRVTFDETTPTPLLYALNADEISAGECYIRFVDSDQTFGDNTATDLEIDYVRVYTSSNTGDNYIDDDTSNVDGENDKGTILNFNNFKEFDSNYGTLLEENTGGVGGGISIDAFTTYGNDASPYSFSHTTPSASNRLLVVNVHTDNGEAVTSVTYSGQLLTLLAAHLHSRGKPYVSVWMLTAPPNGTYTVSISLSSDDKIAVAAISYSGVDQTIPIDNASTNEGKPSSPSITITSEPGDLVQDAMASVAAGVPNPDPTQSQIYAQEMGGSGESDHYGVSSTKAGTSSVTMSWTISENKDWVIIGFNINSVEGELYELDQEVQWTSVDIIKENYRLAIYCGSFNTTENIGVYIWNPGWVLLFSDLNENSWNNVTITSYKNTTIIIRLLGGTETSDTELSEWNIDALIIYGWTEGHDYTGEGNAIADNGLFDSYTESGTGAQYTWNPADQTYTANDTESVQNCMLYIEYQLTDSGENWHVLLYNFTSSVYVNIGTITSTVWANFTYEITDIDFFNATMGFQVRFDDYTGDMIQTSLYIDFIALYIIPISTALNADETILIKEIGETALFNVTFTDVDQDSGITGANLTYLWDYGSGQLVEEGDGVYSLTIFTNSLDVGIYPINVTASLENYESQSIQLFLEIILIQTILTVDETTLTKEIGETAMFRVTFKDSNGFGITGANLTYLWNDGSGQLVEEVNGVYTLSLKTSSLAKGTYQINITASLPNYAVKVLQLSLVIVPTTTGFMDQVRDLLPYISLLILGAFGSTIAVQKYSNRKQEWFDKKNIRRIMVVWEVFALYDQTPSEVITENGLLDRDLVSGFFTAIKDITSEVTGITYETMKVYRAHPYYFVYTGTFYCVIILNDNPSSSLEKKLLLFARIVHEKYSSVIEESSEEYFSPSLGVPNTQLHLDEEVMRIFGLTPITALQDIVTVSLSYNEIQKLKIKDNIKAVLMTGHFLKDQFGTFPLEDLIQTASQSLNNVKDAHDAALEALKLGFINVVEKPLIPTAHSEIKIKNT